MCVCVCVCVWGGGVKKKKDEDEEFDKRRGLKYAKPYPRQPIDHPHQIPLSNEIEISVIVYGIFMQISPSRLALSD